MLFRAKYDGKVLVPEGPVELPTDRLLELDVREVDEMQPGSPKLLLQLFRSLPKLGPGDVEAMMREIEAGQLPVSYDGIFDQQADASE